MSGAEGQPEVAAIFGRLDAAVKAGQAKRGLKACDEILKLAPRDGDALRCKAVLLIEAGRLDEALKLLGEPPLAPGMAFEKAYCLYRCGRLQEALEAVSSVPANQEGPRLQLEAQIHYRLGNNKEAIERYSQLFRSHGAASREVQTNVVAAYVAGGRAGEVPAVMEAMKISAQESFELAFNAACGLVEMGKLADAQQQLQLAVRVGEEALYEEDLQEDEVALELAPVTAQLAYVASMLGCEEESIASYEGLLAMELDDAATASVATNNLFAALLRASPANASRKVAADGLKKLDAFMERSGGVLRIKPSLESRLGAAQREAVLACYATAALLANKLDVAKEAVRSMEKQLPGAPVTAMLQASLLAREGKPREADAALASMAAVDASSAAEAQLLRAQLAAASGNAQQALQHLSGTQDAAWQARPSVLATKVALMEELGLAAEAAATLSAALQHWQSAAASALRAEALRWIIDRLAAVQLREGALAEAAAHYKQLLALDDAALSDAAVLTNYARLAAVCDPGAAAQLRAELGGSSGLPAAELDSLENANIAIAGARRRADEPSVPVPASSKQEGTDAAAAEQKKRKRKRQPRLPKGFDPANPGPLPDPERWLPKWQRSDAKKLRKKMKGKETKGSQGAGKVDDSLDRTNAPDEPAGDSKGKAPARPAGKGKKGKGRR